MEIFDIQTDRQAISALYQDRRIRSTQFDFLATYGPRPTPLLPRTATQPFLLKSLPMQHPIDTAGDPQPLNVSQQRLSRGWLPLPPQVDLGSAPFNLVQGLKMSDPRLQPRYDNQLDDQPYYKVFPRAVRPLVGEGLI